MNRTGYRHGRRTPLKPRHERQHRSDEHVARAENCVLAEHRRALAHRNGAGGQAWQRSTSCKLRPKLRGGVKKSAETAAVIGKREK